MRKVKLVLLFVLFAVSVYGQQATIEVERAWDKVLEQAEKENKLILVDFYTDWCGPCKYMTDNIFPEARVRKTLEENYILFKANVEKEDLGATLAIRYMVKSYPTFLILKPSREVINRFSGYKNAKDFNKIITEASHNRDKVLEGYSTQKFLDFPQFYIDSFNKDKSQRAKTDSTVIESFLADQDGLDNEVTWYVLMMKDLEKQYFEEILKNLDHYKTKFGAASAERMIEDGISKMFNEKAVVNDPKAFASLLDKISIYFEDPGKQQETQLMFAPGTKGFREMEINFIDTSRTISDGYRIEKAFHMLLEKKPKKSDLVIAKRWLSRVPPTDRQENTTFIIALAMSKYYDGEKEETRKLLLKAKSLALGSEFEQSVVEIAKRIGIVI